MNNLPCVNRQVTTFCLTMVFLLIDGLINLRPLCAADWPTYQHDVRRSGYTTEHLEAARLIRVWTWRSHHPPQPAWPGPAKWDAYANLRNLPSMRAYDLVFHPVAVGDAVFFGSSVDDSLYCLDASSGVARWTFTCDGPIRVAPSVVDDKLYFGSDDGHAYCLRTDNGELVWKFRPTDTDHRILNDGRLIPLHPCRTGVLVDRGIAYFGCALLPWKDAYLCAVNANTGKPDTDACYVKKLHGLTLEGPPAATRELLVLPQGRVAPRTFRRSDGQDQGPLKKSSGGSLVVVALDSKVFHGPAADSRRGGINSSNPQTREMIASHGRGNAMAVAGNRSFMLTDDELIAADLVKQETLWTVPSRESHALIVADKTVFLGGDGNVAAVDAETGQEIWRHSVAGRAHGLAVAGGQLLVSTDAGTIEAFAAGSTASEASSSAPPTSPPEPLVAIEPIDDDDLVGRWVFQRPSIRGDTVFAQNGPLNGTLAARPKMERIARNEGLTLDGVAQSVVLAEDHRQAALPQQDITVEAWVRVDRPQQWGGIVGAVQDNGSFERGWLLGYRDAKFCFAMAGQEGTGRLSYLTAKESFALGQWHHVAGVYDGEMTSLYVNGQLANQTDQQQGAIHYPPRAFFEIGAYHDQDEYFRMRGCLHEVRLYRTALAAADIKQHVSDKPPFTQPAQAAPSTFRVASGPWLQFVSPSEAIVRWRTEQPVSTRLTLLRDGKTERQHISTTSTEHQVRLTDLRRRRTYGYSIQVTRDGDELTTPIYQCDTFFNYRPAKVLPTTDSDDEHFSDVARSILNRSQVRQGICLVVGVGNGRLAYELARQSDLRVVGVETDAVQVRAARSMLHRHGCYGSRVTVEHVSDLTAFPLPGHFANLIVSQTMLETGLVPGTSAEMLRLLRPDGGIALLATNKHGDDMEVPSQFIRDRDEQHGGADERVWWKLVRGPLGGAGDWTHLYGHADNSAFGGEQLSGAKNTKDLAVQWIGRPGPRYQSDRSGRKPSPLAVAGRLFLQGQHRIVALDSYNGSPLWSLEIPHFERYNVPRDCGNWCADREFLYVAVRDECWQVANADGRLVKIHNVNPIADHDWKADWGYIARHGDKLVGTAVKQGTSWTDFWGKAGWYDARDGEVTHKVCSDNLFATHSTSGKLLWTYAGGVIMNASITISGDHVYFVESRNDAVKQSPARRVGPEFWQDQYLVAVKIEDGSIAWEQPLSVSPGTVAFYMAHGQDRLVTVSSNDNQFHVNTFSAEQGKKLWNRSFRWLGNKGDHGKALSRPAIVGDRLYVRPQAMKLADGVLLPHQLPGGGCGTYACTADALFFRSSTVTMWDGENGKATNWPRLRPDCWLSTIPAGGMLLSPEGGGGCSCGTWMETSIGFMPLSQRASGTERP
ncbi:MAG: PQQ-binding-like beta-propeller repeat protein [Pirellulaceae bacterium]|nr:PQQ-binding-like beta-propeller repeat protein [Pirellulaceae bacterium]